MWHLLLLAVQVTVLGILCVWVGVHATHKRPPARIRPSVGMFWLNTPAFPCGLLPRQGMNATNNDTLDINTRSWISDRTPMQFRFAISQPKRMQMPISLPNPPVLLPVAPERSMPLTKTQKAQFRNGRVYTHLNTSSCSVWEGEPILSNGRGIYTNNFCQIGTMSAKITVPGISVALLR